MARDRDSPPTRALERAIVWRYSNYDTPFWARENTRAGRWNTAREAAIQYLACEPNAAWGELIRVENLRDEDAVATVRMPLWVAQVSTLVVDYSTFEHAELAGFGPDALIDDDWERCQAEGSRLRSLGYGGVIAPSAALPGATNVTLFGPRILWAWGRQPALSSAIPTTVAAIGSPPTGLVERVRHVGSPHSGFDEYARVSSLRPSPTSDSEARGS